MCYRECRCCRLNLSLTSKFGNDSLANDSIVPYCCRHCTPVTLCWMAACAHTHRTCHLLTWSGHVPLGVTDLGKRSNLSSSLSCFIPLHCPSLPLLCVVPRVEGQDDWWQLCSQLRTPHPPRSNWPPFFFHMPVPVLDVVLNRRRGGRYTAYIEYKVMHLRLSRKKVRLGSVWRWSGIRRCEGNASELVFIYSCWLAVWESRAQSYEELWEAKSCWGSVDL